MTLLLRYFATSEPVQKKRKIELPEAASALAARLQALAPNKEQAFEVVPLDDGGESWYLLFPHYMPSGRAQENVGIHTTFAEEWCHGNPVKARLLNISKQGQSFPVFEDHFSCVYSVLEDQTIKYTGTTHKASPLPAGCVGSWLLRQVQQATDEPMQTTGPSDSLPRYTTVLKNFYAAKLEHSVGRHSGDDKHVPPQWDVLAPIFSLSWGGTRTFVLTPKPVSEGGPVRKNGSHEKVYIDLEDGDLLVMGGRCQLTHWHEVPKYPKSAPVRRDRINWTLRKHFPPPQKPSAPLK